MTITSRRKWNRFYVWVLYPISWPIRVMID